MTTLQYVELGVLGPLQVRQYGLPVAIPGAKPRAVLTMLGLHGGSVVSADTLLELLWGDDPPRTAVKALQTHISALRRALGDGFVLTDGAGWRLSTAEIDATRYKSAASQGRDAIATGDATAAVARFDEALSLWRGIPELPDGRRGVSEKTRWIEGHAALVEDRADALLATGRAAEIIGELEAAIADAPLRERRWGHLMLALYRSGRQGEALGAYRRARSLLADELGVDPGPDLRRLEAAIVTQDVSLELPVSHQLSAVTRAVTFLLTDIEGSTAAWEADADAMAIALARHDEIVEQVVTSRGGRLIKTRGEGDATFSVFDRPSGAAAAAIELQEAIQHEPWALVDPMRIRIALHTGEVEFRDGDYFGRAVNRAARLRSLALGGQILCSGATAELVIDSLSDDVVLADLGKRQLKNLARPERVFELRLESADDSRPATPEPPMERPVLPSVLAGRGPFVGRGLELERLMAAWQSTLATGTRAVLIAGEPGVGKTRLAGEWSRRTYDEGAVVLYGRCDEDLGAPYQPFAEALRSLVPSLGTNRLRGLRGVEALLPLVPGLTDALPDLTTPPRADADTERYALFDAVVALFGVASTSAPVILVLDDLHWAAKPTLLLMRHLLRFGEQARVQIVGTYRSTDLDRSHPLAAMLADLHRDGSADRLTLGGLNENDVTAYVAEAGYEDEELGRALASVTGGNPFFLIEALRHVDESGGKWDPSTLPQGVREAVSRRLSRLPTETNKALAAAAVVGSRFAVDLVERVVGQDLVDAFDEAAKAGILIEELGGRYRFNHALVRQSLLTELASVRRMRLHQKIATALESEPGADDEVLGELAYHYFECAWAGNAVKAVEYCRRAADQAMSRLAYEGAADLYDKALHALEEIDEDLPDRDDLKAELLIARCEALLAAGDVVSATGAVTQLRSAAGDSVRLAAWGICFDGQLSMLTDPERLDEIEVAVGAAAEKLAGLEDAAGEAKAHTVRAGCLARLGRIGDCETALDQALTAARRARDHRRVNAVLAGAPLAALWGPNPVPRAGGRCLDVVRLLRITTGSPVVEATSTRCQGVLDAFRGRAAAGRQLIDSARRTLTELGMRHALLEVDQFAGIVELVADDPAAAERYLRRAYKGFRRMGLDADTADTAALLARACLALDKDAEADELCVESERLAGHALKPSIAWRTVRAQLLARGGEHDEARRVAEEAVAIAERTDELVDHGDACLALASVLDVAGDAAGARSAAEQALALYELKGAAALADKARRILGERDGKPAPAPPERVSVESDNSCVRAVGRLVEALHSEDWEEVEQLFSTRVNVESRRKLVGFTRDDIPSGNWPQELRRVSQAMGAIRYRHDVVAVRGDRLALVRLWVGTADVGPGAPKDEMLHLVRLDEHGRIGLDVWFDTEDMDAALAELDALQTQFVQERVPGAPVEHETTCVRAVRRVEDAVGRQAWDEVEQLLAPTTSVESRRKVVGFGRIDSSSRKWPREMRRYLEDMAIRDYAVIDVRGERFGLFRVQTRAEDTTPGAPQDEILDLIGVDSEGRIALQIFFDVEDMDAAVAQLDAHYAQIALDNLCVQTLRRMEAILHREAWDEFFRMYAPDVVVESRRKIVGFGQADIPSSDWPRETKRLLEVGGSHRIEVIAVRGDRFALSRLELGTPDKSPGAPVDESLLLVGLDDEGRIALQMSFEIDDIDAATAELDAQHGRLASVRPGLENAASRLDNEFNKLFTEKRWDEIVSLWADEVKVEDRRRGLRREITYDHATGVAEIKGMVDLGVTTMVSDVVATRGDRLALTRSRYLGRDQRPEAFHTELLRVVETDPDGRCVASIAFELDDRDAAFSELDTRYLAGEAAVHAGTWSEVAQAYARLNRRELPETTRTWINVDHRRLAPVESGHLAAFVRDAQDLWGVIYIERVHRLSDVGAVVTRAIDATSHDGFDAEWREIDLLTFEGTKISRLELFDEADIEGAIAKFEELSRPARRFENTASRVTDRYLHLFTERNWDTLAGILADDFMATDRRRVVNAETRRGREADIAVLRATAGLGLMTYTSKVLATRGDRLALSRVHVHGEAVQPEAFRLEFLAVGEINADGHALARVMFDPDDLDVAFAELDTRYLAGEAAAHAHTWSAIVDTYAEFNRHDHDPSRVVNIDHRRVARFERGQLTSDNTKDIAPNMRSYIETVHCISDSGAVVTTWSFGTSPEGFEAEWRVVQVQTVEGNRMARNEIFDEADLGSALARFDELNRPSPRLENDASRVSGRFRSLFEDRDWNAIAEMYVQEVSADDRRRVFGGGTRTGRDVEIANLRAMADLGAPKMNSKILATRGRRLVLHETHVSNDEGWEASFLSVLETNADDRIVGVVGFDVDDVEGAFEELDARYSAGEAAAHSQTWSLVMSAHDTLKRHEIPPTTSDWVNIDHRGAAAFASGQMAPYVSAVWDIAPDTSLHVEAVHRLTKLGAVFTYVATAQTQEGFAAEWREIGILTFDGDRINRCELFDESDLNDAFARFDELSRLPTRLDNAATRLIDRYLADFAARDWDSLSDALAQDLLSDDRRRVVNAGARVGRDAEIANVRAFAEVGCAAIISTPVATRGERLLLTKLDFIISGWAEPMNNMSMVVIETDANEQIAASVMFDCDDSDAALAELDARYLRGESAANAHTWSVIAGAYAAVNRHELPAWTADTVTIDHRSTTAFAPGDLAPYLHATWGQTPDVRVDIVAVHRLTSFGAVVTHLAKGTTDQGFEGEWREITLSTIEGDRINRSEMFDETDLESALARLDELSRSPTRLENTASRVEARCEAYIAAGDWNAMAAVLADDVSIDDRRRVVNAGLRRGRQAVIEDLRVGADIGLTQITPTAIAIRGERLTLRRIRYSGGGKRPEAGLIELVQIVEIDADERIAALVLFDADDLEAAAAELDARFAAGEAADHARTWSVIADGCATLNLKQFAATTPDYVYADRRRVASIGAADMEEFFRAAWELTPNLLTLVESVHRLSDLGAVVTQVAQGNSDDGFYAEWRVVNVFTVRDGLLSGCEVFDEADFDAAIARFEELSRPSQVHRNTASEVYERFWFTFGARDWKSMTEILAAETVFDDRRGVVSAAGIRRGRDAGVADMRAVAELWDESMATDLIAVRGGRLALNRVQSSATQTEVLNIVEVDTDDRIIALVAVDGDDLDAAYGELDARYLAGEAAAHAHTYSVISDAFAAVNRHELPSTTTDFVSIDHRRPIAFAPGEMMAYLQATLNDAPEIRIDIETVHRLSSLGAVVSHRWHNTSEQGFDAEWRVIGISTVEGDQINRCELYDEADLDAALARFDELSSSAPKLTNTATHVSERFLTLVTVHDWSAVAELFADGYSLDDRRRTVNSGVRLGRDEAIEDIWGAVDVGLWVNASSAVIATRGERIALMHFRAEGHDPEAVQVEVLQLVETNADERYAAVVLFDVDEIATAIQELDARYVAGEAAAYGQTWAVVAGTYAALNRRESPATTPNWVAVDHRRETAFASGDLYADVRATLDLVPNVNWYIEAVHRSSILGAVVTHAASGTSLEGFDAEWRGIVLVTAEGDLIDRCELFDESDLDAAIARFEELNHRSPQLVNMASRTCERYRSFFSARDWDAIAEMLTHDLHNEDRRRVVNAGIRHGRDSALEDLRAAADLGMPYFRAIEIATRGERLALFRGAAPYDQRPESFHVDVLQLAEIGADGRIAALVTFDVDDIDAAFEELDARYLAGEAAPYAHTWSVIAGAFAAVDRHELPNLTKNWINIDHRRATSFATGDMPRYINATWEDAPDSKVHVEAVRDLRNNGAVVTFVAKGTSQEGFEGEWRAISLTMIDGNRIDRCELFDEDDLDTALARFEELSRPVQRLANAASRMTGRSRACFMARDWDGMRETLADDFTLDDRRHTVNGGVSSGRDATIGDMRTATDVGFTDIEEKVVALRGERLVLSRARYSGSDNQPGAFFAELLHILEIGDSGRITATIVFDVDDVDAAFAELDARYMAGEAAAHADVWSVITSFQSSMNRHELPDTAPDWVNFDHRRVIANLPGEMFASLSAAWELMPNLTFQAVAVHRLTELGGVVTYLGRGTSQEGVDGEWREIALLTVHGDLINRCEMFDEDDLEAAIAKFDELNRPAQPENAALRASKHFAACFASRNWDVISEVLASDVYQDDRRRVIGSGLRHGRDALIADMQAVADLGLRSFGLHFVAARGERLVLTRTRIEGGAERSDAVHVEMLGMVEVGTDGRIAAAVSFDSDDIDAAFLELEGRYIAGEAAAHVDTWSNVVRMCAAFNRREVPAAVPDWVNIDHRRGTAFAPGELTKYLFATWDLSPKAALYIENVHRLTHLGAVVTLSAQATSREGFAAEWRVIVLVTFESQLIGRIEIFDEADLNAARVRFDELKPSARQLENEASRVSERFVRCFANGDWDGLAETVARDFILDDRRRVVGAGVRHGRDAEIEDLRAFTDVGLTNVAFAILATRGESLVLSRSSLRSGIPESDQVHTDMLSLAEVDSDGRMSAAVLFDLDDIEAAVAELDSRYVAGEAAAHADTWSTIANANAMFNRREMPPTTPDWVNIDHRRGGMAFAPGDQTKYMRATWDVATHISNRIVAVHRLNDRRVAFTQLVQATSLEGFDAEWRDVVVMTFDGHMIDHCEVFDEDELDTAIARFEELTAPTPRLENAATRIWEQLADAFNRRDVDIYVDLTASDGHFVDRREGMRDSHHGAMRRRVVETLFEYPRSWQLSVEHVAVRGSRLCLSRQIFRDVGEVHRPITIELLTLIENVSDHLVRDFVLFDPDDLDAAFEELDVRYLSGEGAAHAHTWALVVQSYARFNRHVLPATTPDWTNIDHRRVTAFASGDLPSYIDAAWNVTPDTQARIAEVHRLSDLGVVVTASTYGTSSQGFRAEWSDIHLSTFEGDLCNRFELFDEIDLDAALAKFDEISTTAPLLENAVTPVLGRAVDAVNRRDIDCYLALFTEDGRYEDRRKGLRDEGPIKPDFARALVLEAPEDWQEEVEVIGVRGSALLLCRAMFRDHAEADRPIAIEVLILVEVTRDELISRLVLFDSDDIDAAFAELNIRWIASGEVTHPDVIGAAQQLFECTNRHDWDGLAARESGATFVNHRQLGIGEEIGDHWSSIRTMALLVPDMRVEVAEIPRHSAIGLVTNLVVRGTTVEGTAIELPAVIVLLFDGPRVTRMEAFDIDQRDQALARFDELNN